MGALLAQVRIHPELTVTSSHNLGHLALLIIFPPLVIVSARNLRWDMEDTIAAIATPIGCGAIAIIRLSGPRALAVADVMVRCHAGVPSALPNRTVFVASIVKGNTVLDQILLTVMRGPQSYTGEDIVEFHCHGGTITVRQVLDLCLVSGARLAQPGEFTKRAFLNGKIDLTQAESVMDLITAKTSLAQAAAMRALEGKLSAKITTLRERLLKILAYIQAYLDFPDENIDVLRDFDVAAELAVATDEIKNLLLTAREGSVLRHGIGIAIVGRPNVGKSSLLNQLIGRDRAIVSPVPGTTRDTLEETTEICGVPVRFIDTAGYRTPRGTVESMGVARIAKALSNCDLVLHVFDYSRRLSQSDYALAELYKGKPVISVLNKLDLTRKLRLSPLFENTHVVETCAVSGEGIEKLGKSIEQVLWTGTTHTSHDDAVINERHYDSLRRSYDFVTQAYINSSDVATLDISAQQLQMALNCIGEITGECVTGDILENIFSTFCIGK